MRFDHVALVVKNVYESVVWYRSALKAIVEYEDETWAMLTVGDARIALSKAGHHPAHLAFKVNSINDFPDGCEVKQHRDGSWYYYDRDIDGNVIEWITYSRL
jgi:catechol 2,3-dioxygenase-like lactoylglutathione lyase family enzyme